MPNFIRLNLPHTSHGSVEPQGEVEAGMIEMSENDVHASPLQQDSYSGRAFSGKYQILGNYLFSVYHHYYYYYFKFLIDCKYIFFFFTEETEAQVVVTIIAVIVSIVGIALAIWWYFPSRNRSGN